MRIECIRPQGSARRAEISVNVSTHSTDGYVVILDVSVSEVVVSLDLNHAEALEAALRAARLEAQARSVAR